MEGGSSKCNNSSKSVRLMSILLCNGTREQITAASVVSIDIVSVHGATKFCPILIICMY